MNLFLHHLNACKVKSRLHLRGTKEKSFEINKAESLDNWIFILLFGTTCRCKKYRICQQKDWKLQYLTTRNRKHRYLSWKRFFYMYKSFLSHEGYLRPSHYLLVFTLIVVINIVIPIFKICCTVRALFRASVSFCAGKPLPTHEHRLVWQVLRHPQQTNSITACGAGARSLLRRSQGVLPSVAIHGLPVLGQFLAVRLCSREKLGSWLA